MFEPEIFRKQMYCIEESTSDIVGTFRRPHIDSAPGKLCPLALRRYAPGENREILKDIIANCFLVKQQLAFRSNDESSTSSNRGNYVKNLHTFAAKDERLARHPLCFLASQT